jgi:exosortase
LPQINLATSFATAPNLAVATVLSALPSYWLHLRCVRLVEGWPLPGAHCANLPYWLILSYPPTLDISWIVSTVLQSDTSSVRREAGAQWVLPLWQLIILSGIILWLYRSILVHLVGQWWHDPNFSHGFFVPLFSALIIWQERQNLAQLPLRPSWSGLPIAALALCTLVVGQLGAELFLSRSSLLILLAGLIVLFCGWTYFRALLFPWAFLILMIPIPTIIFNQITFPLQLLASRVSGLILPLLGVPVLREGNVINLPAMALEVAEACSGIRSLMSLVTLAIIYGYLMEKRLWVRWVLAFASVPIAVVANSVRIIGTGLLVQYWDPEKAEGYFHASWGWIIFVISLVMLYGLHSLISMILEKAGAKQ